MYLEYGEKEISYLKSKDKLLGEVIDKVGHIYREVDTDLFSAVIHHIIGQQISTRAQATIWKRFSDGLGTVDAETVCSCSRETLQGFGISFRKADYIKDFAEKVHTGQFDIEALWSMTDEEVIKELSSLKGIGVWTAEMLMTFCMQRPDVVSFGDLAIQRGMRMLYHHRNIDRKKFDKYKRRYSPYGTVASLYLWAVANGAIPEMKDYSPHLTGLRTGCAGRKKTGRR